MKVCGESCGCKTESECQFSNIMNLHQQFPYMARRERRKPVDHGPDNKQFERREGLKFGTVVLVCLMFAIGLVVAALSAWYENVEDS
jgi:uncharacterized membrane protein